MAAMLLPNPNPLSVQPIIDSRSFLPHSFQFTLRNCDKLFWASSISSRRCRESVITFTSQRRGTAFTSDTFVSDDKKEDWGNEEEEEGEEEVGTEFIPLREMTRWLKNKPSGFGEGKRYDTTMEDKLLEEIDQSRKDQPEEKKIPRASAKESAGSVQKQEKQKISEVLKSDTEVRVCNLPKKKNIDRDLWKAFKRFPGIVTINPAVTGNKKTRDPICRGFAFIGFESDDAACRFAQKYSKQNVPFGKIQKQISCDVVNNADGTLISDSTNDIPLVEPNSEVNEDPHSITPISSCQNRKKIVKKIDKTKATKSSKPHILGSLARLKMKDRAVLTGVFSKYGEVVSPASEDNFINSGSIQEDGN